MNQAAKRAKQENPWLSLLFNLFLPIIILTKFSGDEYLGSVYGLVFAVLFPSIYGVYDYIKRRKINFISALGFLSVVFTGGLGLLEVDGVWFAIKEAAFPGVIGLVLLISTRTKRPLINVLLYNESIMQIGRIEAALNEKNNYQKFRDELLQATYLMSLAFAISAVINFVLAYVIIKSPGGTTQFNEELGYMTALSYPVILVCSSSIMIFALWRLVKHIKDLTGLELEEIFHISDHKKPSLTKAPDHGAD